MIRRVELVQFPALWLCDLGQLPQPLWAPVMPRGSVEAERRRESPDMSSCNSALCWDPASESDLRRETGRETRESHLLAAGEFAA